MGILGRLSCRRASLENKKKAKRDTERTAATRRTSSSRELHIKASSIGAGFMMRGERRDSRTAPRDISADEEMEEISQISEIMVDEINHNTKTAKLLKKEQEEKGSDLFLPHFGDNNSRECDVDELDRTQNIPRSIHLQFDEVSAISLEHCLRTFDDNKTVNSNYLPPLEDDEEEEEDFTPLFGDLQEEKQQQCNSPAIVVTKSTTTDVSGDDNISYNHDRESGDNSEGEATDAIEVMLPGQQPEDQPQSSEAAAEPEVRREDPSGRDCTSGAGAEEILESLKSMQQQQQEQRSPPQSPLLSYRQSSQNHHNNPYIPHHLLPQSSQQQLQYQPLQSPQRKQRNSLLKYQQATISKAAQMKQTIKGYFRYVPKGEEGNDHSVISL